MDFLLLTNSSSEQRGSSARSPLVWNQFLTFSRRCTVRNFRVYPSGAHELSVLRTRQLTLERTTNALREQLAGCEKRLQAASEGKNTTELKMEAKKLKDMLDHAESE